MDRSFKAAFQVRGPYGPRVDVPFPAIDMKFTYPATQLHNETGWLHLTSIFDEWELTDVFRLEKMTDFTSSLVQFYNDLIRAHESGSLPITCTRQSIDVGTLSTGYFHVRETVIALEQAYALTCVLACGPDQAIRVNRSSIQALMAVKEGNFYLLRAAATLDIPIIELATRDTFQGGQGRLGQIFHGSSTAHDSYFGFKTQSNKLLTNKLIKQAGFPGVEHEIVDHEEDMKQIALRLGYPIVVKPLHGTNGVGATANIRSEQHLLMAFKSAKKALSSSVLVEKHVDGEEFRILVASGKYVGTRRKLKTGVLGDGISSIKILIEFENEKRLSSIRNKRRIIRNDLITEALERQGLSLSSVLPNGTFAELTVAFTTELGTSEDASAQIHDDNVAMAESVASLFRMSTLGIDFICQEIGTPWYEQTSAIIEVNAKPTIRSEEYARLTLCAAFGEPPFARIPSTLVISSDIDFARAIWQVRQQQNRNVGLASQKRCFFDLGQRSVQFSKDQEAVTALLINPRCEAIIIHRTLYDLKTLGLPLDKFDECIIHSKCFVENRTLNFLSAFCQRVKHENLRDIV